MVFLDEFLNYPSYHQQLGKNLEAKNKKKKILNHFNLKKNTNSMHHPMAFA